MPAPAVRTTEALVKGIIEVQEGFSILPFIRTANEIVTANCTYADEPYTDDGVDSKMEIIERWVSAHLYTIYDNMVQAAKAGSAAVSFNQKIDYGLKNSMYGQQALILDHKGGLAKLDNSIKTMRKIKISMTWLGLPNDYPLYGDQAALLR